MHSWGDEDYPCLSLPAIPATRTETDEEWQTRNLQYFTDSNAGLTYLGEHDRHKCDSCMRMTGKKASFKDYAYTRSTISGERIHCNVPSCV